MRGSLEVRRAAAPPFDHVSFLGSMVINAGDAVIITEAAMPAAAGRIVYVNAAFTRLTGYSESEALNASPQMLQGARSNPDVRAKMRDAVARRISVSAELINYRKDGSEYLVEIGLTPVIDAAGICTHWIAIERDVTARQCSEPADDRTSRERNTALVAEIAERERAQELLAYKASHDDLTGLYNRGNFVTRVESAIARAQADPSYAFSLLLLDLDRFKLVNDHLGHRKGDRVLCDLARRFAGLAGRRHTVARIDGDEFALLIEQGEEVDEAVTVAGRLIMEIANRPRSSDDDVVLSASIGIVHYAPGMDDAELMMRDAETALARSQIANGSSYAVFTPEMHAQAECSARVRNDLYGAVERGEMRLFYQPLVDIATGGVYGFEGLVRWQHPERGLVQPDEFIPAAEETGLIVELGRWVLIEGCAKATAFQHLAGKPLMMSLNVSSQQLLHPHFLDHLKEALDLSGLEAATLQLEVTESVFLAGGTAVGAVFAKIRALGIQIAFDDFGTGYSSLSYLERFQIDTLKIDKSFVARIHDTSAKSEILRMIIALAHALGVDIVAEGVESRAQRDALGHLGCTHLQGFLFSRPISETAVLQLLGPCSAGSELDTLLEETLTDVGLTVLSEEQRGELRDQVDRAIETHHVWLDRLQTAVETGNADFDVAQVAREDLCPIGIWLTSTISETLRTMPLYYVTKSRHAVFHRSMARVFAAAAAGRPEAAQSLRPDGDLTMVAASLLRTLHDWRAVATVEPSAMNRVRNEPRPTDRSARPSRSAARLTSSATAECPNEEL